MRLSADNLSCRKVNRLRILAQPHPNRDLFRNLIAGLLVADPEDLMRELQSSAGMDGQAHAARRQMVS